MKKVLWFSRHEMSKEQEQSIINKVGEIKLFHINKTIKTAFEIAEFVDEVDIVAIVAPINLQSQFLKIAKGKPVITAISNRKIIKNDDGSEDKVVFEFNRWEQLKKIEVVTEIFSD